MSSSLLARRSAACVTLFEDRPLYRQIDYYDGQCLRISESRQRSHVISPELSSPRQRAQTSASRPVQSSATNSTSSAVTNVHPNAALSKRTQGAPQHVTSQSSRSKAKPVVIQAPIPQKVCEGNRKPRVGLSNIPTPPATPRIERLPTPELSDLEEGPFCDCCMDAHVIKYCASCGVKMNRSRH